MPDLILLNGPNLNLLGEREPEIYGHTTLSDIEQMVAIRAASHGFSVTAHQSNHEGQLLDWIHAARKETRGLIINPGAFTHTSVALHDALKAYPHPLVEVHLSNPHAREPFRHQSYVAPLARAVVMGLGAVGYEVAVDALARWLQPC